MKLFIMVGIPGSGKSTHAKIIAREHEALIVSSDALRARFGTSESDFGLEPFIWRYISDVIERALLDGLNVILDSTALTPKTRKPYVEIARRCNVELISVLVDVPAEVAKSRNDARVSAGGRHVPHEVIETHYKKLVKPSLTEGFTRLEEIQG